MGGEGGDGLFFWLLKRAYRPFSSGPGSPILNGAFFATFRVGSIDYYFPFSSGYAFSRHSRIPPSIEITFLYPIFCRLSAASAERKPPPQ